MKLLIATLALLSFGMTATAAEIDSKASEFKWTGKKVTGQHYGKLPVKSSKLLEKEGKITGGEVILDISKMTVEDLTRRNFLPI